MKQEVQDYSIKCKRVASMKESTSPVIALQEILHYNPKFPTYFMKEGLDKEPEIISKYIAEMQEDSHQVSATGLSRKIF